MKKKTKYTSALFFCIMLFTFEIQAESDTNPEPNNERKKFHIYITPVYLSRYTEYPFRTRPEKKTLTALYGLTNNLYMGISYNRGESQEERGMFAYTAPRNSSGTQEYKKTREGEYFVFKTQYFFGGNFYGSINLGLEKGFKIEEKNFLLFQGNNIQLIPYSKSTIYSDRHFVSAGVGYRKEIFEYFILGTEFEYGVMNSGNTNQHYTFDPSYYNGLPTRYVTDQLILRDRNKPSSEYMFISFYAGIAI
ncbi:hypothetical protein EHQ24_03005 [Leptospira noumeaensis]|uniref:Outer membrane protein beta-barrel domain-containing protein n=1 Tax=Leptospira noumeaensis TaxID=2484964 RepID=A0A4R9IIG5_9LEPT|nr:hypothetical protein [Leptospira noumeaensis]TGK87515.1 hypothetical protein EHQ24_03005 [Leptospira noumeaensis]